MHIEISGISVEIKKKNIKNMHLYVQPPEGNVWVSAPMHLSEESIMMFVRSKIAYHRYLFSIPREVQKYLVEYQMEKHRLTFCSVLKC